MNFLQTYNGVKIYKDAYKHPFVTVQDNIPVIGQLQTGHKTLKDAKEFIDNHINKAKK